MGNRQSKPRRRNSEGTEKHLQYHTNHGPVPAHIVQDHIQRAPPANERTRSGYPTQYRNDEGPRGNTRKNFDTYTTGPGRAQSNAAAGQLHEYPIPMPNRQNHFRYDERPLRANQINRPLHPNERANVMGPSGGRPRNDPGQMRAVTRVAAGGRNVVVGVMDHPPGNLRGFQRAPYEPVDREGRQAAQRHVDQHLLRQQTVPPRGQDALVVAGFETRYERVRAPRRPGMRG